MSASGTGGHASPISPSGDDAAKQSSPVKRKHDGEGIAQPRAKRNRYISIACNECKRRKIKCNGETPCQRCGNLSLECVYAPNCCSNGFKDSDEYRQMTFHLQSLQDQVNNLFASLSEFQPKSAAASVHVNGVGGIASDVAQSNGTVDPQFAFQTPTSRCASEQHGGPVRAYSGPVNSNFYLDQTTGNMRGLDMDPHDVDDTANTVSAPKPVLGTPSPGEADVTEHGVSVVKDPLWNIPLSEALRLCRGFSELYGSVWPIVDVEKATKKAQTMCNFLDSMKRVGLMKQESERGDSFCDNETLVLKMVLALATSQKDQVESALGQSLFENVRRIVNGEDRLGAPATILGLQLWVLIATYYFKIGAELRAYRTIGIAARQCFEIGLNRNEIITSMFDKPEGTRDALRLFWVIYIFDNRLAANTGLPFAIHDADIDPSLPPIDDQFPYARAMLCYCKIASRISAPVAGFESTGMDLKMDNMSWIDWQISQWCGSIPEELRFTHLDFSLSSEEMSRNQKELRVELYLRGNQLRLQLYRPVFYTQASTLENRGYAQTVMEIAKDNIRTLSEMDKATDIYTTAGSSFHYYLVQALGVLFLGVAQAPVEFSRQVRDEFYLGVELIKSAARDSVPLQRLGRTVANLKKLAPKLELLSPSHPAAHPLANGKDGVGGIGGLAVGALVDDPAHWHTPHHLSAQHHHPLATSNAFSAPQLAFELVNLFETACGFGDAMLSKHEALLMNGMDAAVASATLETFAGLWRSASNADNADFAKAMKDVF